MSELTQDEKIDYIYNHIKSEKRNKILKIVFKIIFVFFIFFYIKYLITNIWQEQIKSTISTQIWEITSPIIKDLVDDLYIPDSIKENVNLLDNIKKYDY